MTAEKNEKHPLIYLNTAAVGLLSTVSSEAAAAFQNESTYNASGAFMGWIQNRLPELRASVATLTEADISEVAFAPNFSFGLISVLQSIRPELKRVLLYRDDYPSLNLPFELGGFEVHYVENNDGFDIPLSKIEEIAEREKIQVISVSHVQFLTGYTTDLEELAKFCREKNIVLIADTTQSLGASEIDFSKSGADVMITSSYKWLNGGTGSAVILAKQSFQERFTPRVAGFGSMSHSDQGWSYHPSVLSYEPGHLNAAGLLQLEQSVRQRLEVGIASVVEHNRKLVHQLAAGLEKLSFDVKGGYGAEKISTILCFKAGKEVFDHLTANNVVVTWRKGLIRVSPHFYNTEEDIDGFLELLSQV